MYRLFFYLLLVCSAWLADLAGWHSFILLSLLIFGPLSYERFIRHKDPLRYYGLTKENVVNSKSGQEIMLCLFFFMVGYIVFGMFCPGQIMAAKQLALPPMPVLFFALAAATFFEELWFRGVILFKLAGCCIKPIPAIISQALVFGLLHFYLFLRISFLSAGLAFALAFLSGLYFGHLALKYKSIWPSWVVHWLINFVVMAA